ncbi:MAG: indole-3-glycerol-phosphate synthase [Woeseia sp.]
MIDFLKTMAEGSAQRAAAIRRTFAARDFDLPILPLNPSEFDLIAEIKDSSPSEGQLATHAAGRADRALQYVQGGATAISVLTEPSRFGGELGHLREVANAVSGSSVPVMRKDFLVDTKQILEARAAGASGVLLIVALLERKKLMNMLHCAFEHSLFVLLESFDEVDLKATHELLQDAQMADRAAHGQLLVGINARDLRSLAVDPERLAELASRLPEQAIAVAESGLRSAGDAATAASLGYRMALVGTALMREPNPAVMINEMLLAGRAAAAEQEEIRTA